MINGMKPSTSSAEQQIAFLEALNTPIDDPMAGARISMFRPEQQIADARDFYLNGRIDEVEFERRVEAALTVY